MNGKRHDDDMCLTSGNQGEGFDVSVADLTLPILNSFIFPYWHVKCIKPSEHPEEHIELRVVRSQGGSFTSIRHNARAQRKRMKQAAHRSRNYGLPAPATWMSIAL